MSADKDPLKVEERSNPPRGPEPPDWAKHLREILRTPQVVVFLLGSLPIVIAYVFWAGHLVTDSDPSAREWPMPFIVGAPIVAIVSGFCVMVLSGMMIFSGFAMSNGPEDRGVKLLRRSRAVLYVSLLIGLLLFGCCAFVFFHVLHHPISPWVFVIVPVGAFGLAVTSSALAHGWRRALFGFSFPAGAAIVYWLGGVALITELVATIAHDRSWAWSSDVQPWEYLAILLVLSALGSLFASERHWTPAWATGAFCTLLFAILDPTNFFALPFRLLHFH